jgi:hypothetical protein
VPVVLAKLGRLLAAGGSSRPRSRSCDRRDPRRFGGHIEQAADEARELMMKTDRENQKRMRLRN